MQIAQAARWAKAGSVIHHQAVPSLATLLAARALQAGLSYGPASHLVSTVGHGSILNTVGDKDEGRGQALAVGDLQIEEPHNKMRDRVTLLPCLIDFILSQIKL